MREVLDWIVDHAVPILGVAAVGLLGGAGAAAYAGYYVVAGIAGTAGIGTGIAAREIYHARERDELMRLNQSQALTIQGQERENRQVVGENTRLLEENRLVVQRSTALQRQIDQLTNERGQLQTQINTLEARRNELELINTNNVTENRRIQEALRVNQNTSNRLQNEVDRLNERIQGLERQRQEGLPRVGQAADGVFGARAVHRRVRNDVGGQQQGLRFH